MILDDNSKEISIRRVELLSLKDNTIEFQIKHTDKKQVKTYESNQFATDEFERLSRRIENYIVVKSGKPLNDR